MRRHAARLTRLEKQFDKEDSYFYAECPAARALADDFPQLRDVKRCDCANDGDYKEIQKLLARADGKVKIECVPLLPAKPLTQELLQQLDDQDSRLLDGVDKAVANCCGRLGIDRIW